MDPVTGRYESVGSADAKVSYTSLGDAGKVVAQLCRMQMGAAVEEVRVAGDTRSMREVAEMMVRAQREAADKEGGPAPVDFEITELELGEYKRKVVQEGTKDPSKYLRFLMGEGKIEHSKEGGRLLGCDNEVVNPSETNWKWKTVEDYARDTKGRPWDDVKWDADKVE